MLKRKSFRSIALCSLAAALLSATAAPAMAGELDQTGRLQIVRPWTNLAVAGSATRLHMKMVNDGPDDLHVIKLTSPIASAVQLVLVEAGSQRVKLPSITLFAHESMDLGRSHVRVTLKGLRRDLRAGEQFPLTFHLAPHGRITTTVTVGDPAVGGAF